MTVLAIPKEPYRNNAELIVQCVQLGYLRKEWATLDPTYGRGGFWKLWRPADLTASDIKPTGAKLGIDFRKLPWHNDRFNAVVFDPPYKYQGAVSDAEFGDRYGVSKYRSVKATNDLICGGLTECIRVTAPKGYLLVKCMDQVCGGKVRWQTYMVQGHAALFGATLVDRLEYPTKQGRPQPERKRKDGTPSVQHHARRNHSTLLVLRKDT